MAKITTEQVRKVNSKCSNKWRLDTQYYLYHGEKRLINTIELDKENYLQFALCYNNQNQMILHISKFYHKQGENYASTSGLGKCKVLVETPVKRKNVNNLINYTNQLDHTRLLELNKSTPVSKSNGLILESEAF